MTSDRTTTDAKSGSKTVTIRTLWRISKLYIFIISSSSYNRRESRHLPTDTRKNKRTRSAFARKHTGKMWSSANSRRPREHRRSSYRMLDSNRSTSIGLRKSRNQMHQSRTEPTSNGRRKRPYHRVSRYENRKRPLAVTKIRCASKKSNEHVRIHTSIIKDL